MEYLDAYDENKNYLGKFSREEVHTKGLWHNTVHCWLYDEKGNVYFQIRSDSGKLYTTASGHVKAGETLKEAFGREVNEEIGIDVNYDQAELLTVNIWKMDKEKNGVLTKDRAFANVHLLKIDDTDLEFKFLDGEVEGIAKLKAEDALKLFNDECDTIDADMISKENVRSIKRLTKDDFLLMKGETLISKYGLILEAVKGK